MQIQHACEELYREMLSEVHGSHQLDLSSSSRIAYSFKIAVEYWNKLKEQIKARQFTSEAEEIWFFKMMKPKFTAMMEYYTMVYHAELFMPSLKEEDIFAFWKKENDKVKKFYRKHSAFCEYYKSGRTHLDQIYFVRNGLKEPCDSSFNRLYDTDHDMITSHGHLATSLLAYDMYEAYIREQVKKVA